MEINVGGVPQGVQLFLEGRSDARVTVTDAHGHDAAEQVQVPAEMSSDLHVFCRIKVK